MEFSALQKRQILKLTTKSKKERKLPTASELLSLSADTIKRKYPDRVVHLSDKRVGISLGDCLDIIAAGKS
jgi:hypothetical protein